MGNSGEGLIATELFLKNNSPFFTDNNFMTNAKQAFKETG